MPKKIIQFLSRIIFASVPPLARGQSGVVGKVGVEVGLKPSKQARERSASGHLDRCAVCVPIRVVDTRQAPRSGGGGFSAYT